MDNLKPNGKKQVKKKLLTTFFFFSREERQLKGRAAIEGFPVLKLLVVLSMTNLYTHDIAF